MDHPMNGAMSNVHPPAVVSMNGIHHEAGTPEPAIEELERELPAVYDGQVPLGDLLSRVMQSIYAELSELAETCVCSSAQVQAFATEPYHAGCQTCLTLRERGFWPSGSLKRRSRWSRCTPWLNGLATQILSRNAWCSNLYPAPVELSLKREMHRILLRF